MRHLVLAIALLTALPAAAHGQSPRVAAPAATTGAARDVTPTSATVTGTVDPNGLPATYRFEYGPTTAYGQVTPDASAGEGDDAVPAEATISGLAPTTTYHYRVVAIGPGGTTRGADRTLVTAAIPRPPAVSKTTAVSIGPTGATLRSTLDPGGVPTSFHFEYGNTSAYGARTPERDGGSRNGGAVVSEPITGLAPVRRYHFRVVATNQAGTVTSSDRSFVTDRLPTAVTIALDAPSTPWGEGIEAFGRVSGTGAGGILVALERQTFPFSASFAPVGGLPTRADRLGRYRIAVPWLFSATRLRAVTRTAVVAVSPTVSAGVSVRVGIETKRASSRRVRVLGSVQPSAARGRAVLQRRTAKGGWTSVSAAKLERRGSRYAFTVARAAQARRFRVRVTPRDGGAHVAGTSASVVVTRLPRR